MILQLEEWEKIPACYKQTDDFDFTFFFRIRYNILQSDILTETQYGRGKGK